MTFHAVNRDEKEYHVRLLGLYRWSGLFPLFARGRSKRSCLLGNRMSGVDKHSKTLLVNHIELLLNYCMRFYERQFITRGKTNRDVLTRFENLLDEYFESALAEQDGLPTVKYFADKLCLSSNYFGDMFKKETGKSPQEYIQEKVIELAKERISDTADTVSQIAYSLGFQYPQHFCRLFKKRVGYTPSEYRAQIGLSTNL